jgi:asparagine synthase (glutamine-hydrolysing)
MCGISGIVNRRDQPVDPSRLALINGLVRHRGPDDEGAYFGRNIALGHRRLSILDLSPRGHQPMPYHDRYWITYNGEVYNYLEIRSELEARGSRFETSTDTEVILAAFDMWGPECLRRFNGMWAFAIHDVSADTLFLARDRFGVKPLHYTITDEEFAFGSELRQMLAVRQTVRANQGVVIESLLTGIDGHTEDTFFADIKVLPQASYGIYDLRSHEFRIQRYYRLAVDPEVARMSPATAAAHFRELLTDAVCLRLRSDVRVGTCLSGGLDSSATSSLASGVYRGATGVPFIGVHAKSIDAEVDESRFAQLVAHHADLELHVVEPSTADFASTIEDVVRTQEEPFGSPSMFMGWHVFRKAQELGCKVMLNGQGGDEVLLGYERYFAAFLKSVSMIRFVREMIAQSRHSRLQLHDIALYYLYFTKPALRIRTLKRRSMLRRAIKDAHDFAAIYRSAESFRDVADLQIHEIATLQLPHLLRYEDRNSMWHSIETRLPFLDYRLVEFCVSLRAEWKIQRGWTKYILRE